MSLSTSIVTLGKNPKLNSSNWETFWPKLLELMKSNCGLVQYMTGVESPEVLDEIKAKNERIEASRTRGEVEAWKDALGKDIEHVRSFLTEKESEMEIEGAKSKPFFLNVGTYSNDYRNLKESEVTVTLLNTLSDSYKRAL